MKRPCSDNIQNFALMVVSTLFLATLIILFIVLFNYMDKKENDSKVEEYKLLSVSIYHQPTTNRFGGITGTSEYCQYCFNTASGEVEFDEVEITKNVIFKIGDENVLYKNNDNNLPYTYEFVLTENVYYNIFDKQDKQKE